MVYIIISHRDDFETTLKCIYFINKYCENFKIIVIDSSKNKYIYDESIEVLYQSSPISVTKSWNLGLIRCFSSDDCDAICIIGNDVYLNNDIFTIMKPFINKFNAFLTPVPNSTDIFNEPVNVMFALGMHCIVAKKSIFANVGLFNEDFFLYYQDSDYFERIRLLGMLCLQINDARCEHIGQSNTRNIYTDKEINIIGNSDLIKYVNKYPWVNTNKNVRKSIPLSQFLKEYNNI